MNALSGLADRAEMVRRMSVWSKGRIVPSLNPMEWRDDAFGNRIRYSDYGNRNSVHGWEIDHIIPLSAGGLDSLSNLRPRHCISNARQGTLIAALLSQR